MAQVTDPPGSRVLSRPSVTPGAGAAGAFAAWTVFVWAGRIRNAITDPALSSGDRLGPVLLAASFLVPAIALGIAVLSARRRREPLGTTTRRLAALLAGWTTAVWVLRAADIALGGDHEAGFVAVHLVLAVTSIGLGAWAVSATARRRGPGDTETR